MPKFSNLVWAMIALVCSSATTAHAADILGGVSEEDCPANVRAEEISGEYIFERALARNGVLLTTSERTRALGESPAWSSFSQSVLTVREEARLHPERLRGASKARGDLYLALDDFLAGRDRSNLATAQIGPTAPAASTERIRQFLMRQSDSWLTVSCTVRTASPPDRGGQENAFLGYLRGARIARDLQGAQAGLLKDRSFATLSGRHDENSGAESYSFEGLALFPALWTHAPRSRSEGAYDAALHPYLGFERSSADDPLKELNDLTFGLLAPFNIDGAASSWLPAEHYFALSAAWETDDSLESSMTLAELVYTPTWGGRFGDERRTPCVGPGRCAWSLSGLLDFAEVGDATGKPRLANVDQYARSGFNLGAGFYVGPADGWEVSLTGDYRLRDSFTEDDGDAQMFKARLAFAPSNTSNLSIGLDYVRGEDLTSLDAQEYWAFSLGVRR